MFNNYLTLFQSKVPPLAFHSMTLCKDTIYIYGGITTNNKINGDLLFLNAFSNKFVNARYEANQYIFPSPRHSHSATYDKTNNKLYIFGGYTNSKVKFTNELWMLEPNEKMSKFVKLQTPEKISPRCQHCSFIYEDNERDIVELKGMILNVYEVYEANTNTTNSLLTIAVQKPINDPSNDVYNKD